MVELGRASDAADGIKVVPRDDLVFASRTEADNALGQLGIVNGAQDVVQRVVREREEEDGSNLVGKQDAKKLYSSEGLAGTRRTVDKSDLASERVDDGVALAEKSATAAIATYLRSSFPWSCMTSRAF